MNNNTIHSIFIKTAERCKDKVAFNYFNGEWTAVTYSEFLLKSQAIASALIKKGVNKGERIAIVSENRPEWCMSYMGIMMAGAVAVPVDSQLNPEPIRNFLTDSDSKIVFCSFKTGQNIDKAINSLSIKKINFDSAAFKGICRTEGTVSYPKTDPDDIASIIYTSGTTGVPKGVMLTHKNFCSDAEAAIRADVIAETDNLLSLLPLHHTYPFMCTFLVPALLGAQVTYSPSLKGPDIVASINGKHVTILIGVPQILEMIRNGILNKIKQLPFPLGSIINVLLKFCGNLRGRMGINPGKIFFSSAHKALGKQFRFFASGGAKLDPAVMKDLEALGFTVVEGYGLTETSPIVTFNPIKKRKSGSVGKPLPSVDINIVDTEKGELGIMQAGEIVIKGPMVMKGYYKNPEATSQAIKNGWFFSGDLGYIDRDGYVFITGRIKEVIVLTSGKNIYPEDVEKEYMKIPLIKEICIFASAEKGGEELLRAVIVPDFDYARQQKIGNISEALGWEIIRISNNLPSYMRVKGFGLYPEPLPRTPLGKLRRFMIKEDLIEAGGQKPEARSEDQKLTGDETGRRIVRCITPLLREPLHVQANDNLELDLGLDSLQRIELIVSIEREFSLKLPEIFASDVQTVDDLVRKIKEASAGRPGWLAKENRGEQRIAEESAQGQGFSSILSQEISEEEKKGVGLKQGAAEWIFALFLMGIQKLLFKLLFRLEVSGIENIPKNRFIIVTNHCSYLDGFIISSGVPAGVFRNLYFQGFQKYFTGRLTSFFAKLAHVIPIDPDTYLNKALQLSGYVLRNNKSLCIFPEGGRSYDGNVMEFKKGIGILALELAVPVVPGMIKGSFEAFPRHSKLPRPKKITLTFGKPVYPAEIGMAAKPAYIDKYQFFSNEIRKKVIGLSDSNPL